MVQRWNELDRGVHVIRGQTLGNGYPLWTPVMWRNQAPGQTICEHRQRGLVSQQDPAGAMPSRTRNLTTLGERAPCKLRECLGAQCLRSEIPFRSPEVPIYEIISALRANHPRGCSISFHSVINRRYSSGPWSSLSTRLTRCSVLRSAHRLRVFPVHCSRVEKLSHSTLR